MAATPASARVSPRLPPDTPPRIASHCAAMYAKGAVAALSMHRVARYASRSKRLRTLAARCVLVNGVVFLGSLAVLDHALVPFIGWVLHRWTAADAAGGAGGGAAGRSSLAASASSSFLWTARAAWLYPTYFASTVVNSFTAGEMARISCALAAEDDAARALARRRVTGSVELDAGDSEKRDSEKKDGSRRRGVAGLAEAVYHVLIVNSLFAQITALSFVLTGPIGTWVTRALQTWLYAYYCHDYLWSARGKPPAWRVTHFEGNWCYFAGFGSPIVLISAMNLSTFYAAAVQAMAFPVFMIAAIASGGEDAEVCLEGKNAARTRQGAFPVFHLASASARAVLRLAGVGGGAGDGGAKRTKGE